MAPGAHQPVEALRAWIAFRGEPQAYLDGLLAQVLEESEARALFLAAADGEGNWSILRERCGSPAPADLHAWRREALALTGGIEDDAVHEATLAETEPPIALSAVRLVIFHPDDRCGLVLVQEREHLTASTGRILHEVALLSECRLQRLLVAQARQDVAGLSDALDLGLLLGDQSSDLAACMLVCNELCARFSCDRVSLGWKKGDYIRLKAVSYAEKFLGKMDAVRDLEQLMEECLDQDEELLYPAVESGQQVLSAHRKYAASHGRPFLVSLPLREGEAVEGVLTAERSEQPFTQAELDRLRLCGDQCAPHLTRLHRADRWWGARWMSAARDKLASLLGPEHTWAKLLSITGLVLVLVFLLGSAPYSVKAPFIIRARTTMMVAAPFDGYITDVHREPGQVVAEGDLLLELDPRELLLEKVALTAERTQYEQEAEKARAENQLADMRISRALADQAEAKLAWVESRLDQARVSAPLEGVVVEGDLREQIGIPVSKGTPLLRISRLDDLYAEVEIHERDRAHVAAGHPARLVFSTHPGQVYAMQVLQVDPAAQSKQQNNVFLGESAFTGTQPDWVRPGMTGMAKIDAGRRKLCWIYTHRTLDALRLRGWW